MSELLVRDFIQPASDGFPLSMRLIRPQTLTRAVLVSSGTGFPKGFYERFARHLAGQGCAVLTYDYRGIAGSRPDDLAALQMDYPDWGRLDMAAALDALIEAGTDLPRGVFETWKRWCLNPAYFRDELKDRLQPHQFEAVTAPIRSWIFPDDPIATPRTGPLLLQAYPKAPSEICLRQPSDYGVRRIGHEGAFRRGMEPLWDEIFH